MIPPSNNSTKYKPFCATKLISPRSVPAIVRPIPANALVPNKTTRIASNHVAFAGRHPSIRPIGNSTIICTTSTQKTLIIFASISLERPSGVAPKRFSTWYERSKPVAIPRLTMALDITARARMPGNKNCAGLSVSVGRTSTRPKKTKSKTGIPSVRSNCSPLRDTSCNSARSWARRALMSCSPMLQQCARTYPQETLVTTHDATVNSSRAATTTVWQ